jgi:hypothetical protein
LNEFQLNNEFNGEHNNISFSDLNKFINERKQIENNLSFITYPKQEGHDGPEVAHLYIGPRSGASLKPGAFI